MKKSKLQIYGEKINRIVRETEKAGGEMHDFYNLLHEAIEQKKEAEISSEKRKEITEVFVKGTDVYQEQLQTLKKLQPTPQLMGLHKKFERNYEMYYNACMDMVKSVRDEKIVVELFRSSEKEQEEKRLALRECLRRMSAFFFSK